MGTDKLLLELGVNCNGFMKKLKEANSFDLTNKVNNSNKNNATKLMECEARLKELDFQICKGEQDLLRDIEKLEKNRTTRLKYNYFIQKFASQLCNKQFYASVYDAHTEEIVITKKEPSKAMANGKHNGMNGDISEVMIKVRP